MTEEERILAQIKQLYPNISDEQLSLMIISLDKTRLKNKVSKIKERRFGLSLFMLMAVALNEGKSETAAIRVAQQLADENGKNEEYVRTLWRRWKRNPEKYKRLLHEEYLELVPFMQLANRGNIKRIDEKDLWAIVFNSDPL